MSLQNVHRVCMHVQYTSQRISRGIGFVSDIFDRHVAHDEIYRRERSTLQRQAQEVKSATPF